MSAGDPGYISGENLDGWEEMPLVQGAKCMGQGAWGKAHRAWRMWQGA